MSRAISLYRIEDRVCGWIFRTGVVAVLAAKLPAEWIGAHIRRTHA